MTERSGLAAKAPRTKQAPTPIKDKNRFATPQNGVEGETGQALRSSGRKLWGISEKLVEILFLARTVCDHEKPARPRGAPFRRNYEVKKEGRSLVSFLKEGGFLGSMRQFSGCCLDASCKYHNVGSTSRRA